jgi:hypothetical protein
MLLLFYHRESAEISGPLLGALMRLEIPVLHGYLAEPLR